MFNTCFFTNLFKPCPVIKLLSRHESPQLLRCEQLHHVPVTRLEEATPELLEHTVHRGVEDVVDVGLHKLPPTHKTQVLPPVINRSKLFIRPATAVVLVLTSHRAPGRIRIQVYVRPVPVDL